MKTITANMVSGVILAVKGSIDEFGEFVVSFPRCFLVYFDSKL
jgi:hypothetical protein